eukprot:2390772-Rhodomonas_salina.1
MSRSGGRCSRLVPWKAQRIAKIRNHLRGTQSTSLRSGRQIHSPHNITCSNLEGQPALQGLLEPKAWVPQCAPPPLVASLVENPQEMELKAAS